MFREEQQGKHQIEPQEQECWLEVPQRWSQERRQGKLQ